MTTTELTRVINAPRSEVYRALLEAEAVQHWMVPDGMTSEVHAYEAHEGGRIRISLTYGTPTIAGKTTAHTDTLHGRFDRLVHDSEVVQIVEFDSADPSMSGEMTMRYTLEDIDGRTLLTGTHEHVPPGVSAEDYELGWSISIGKLAALAEGRAPIGHEAVAAADHVGQSPASDTVGTDESTTRGGRCTCGSVRYEASGPLRDIVNCHCTRCRRFTGHHMAATAVAAGRLQLLASETLQWYQPDERVHYGFCGRCGSSLFWKADAGSSMISIAAGTLDQPTGLHTTTAWWVAEVADYHERQAGLIEHPYDGD